eukprot:1053727-Amorphochlora_amoeboformis.AAC.1
MCVYNPWEKICRQRILLSQQGVCGLNLIRVGVTVFTVGHKHPEVGRGIVVSRNCVNDKVKAVL